MGMLIKRLSLVAQRANCAIEIVHHVRKPSQGSGACGKLHQLMMLVALVHCWVAFVRRAFSNVMDKETADLCGFSGKKRLSCRCLPDGEKST